MWDRVAPQLAERFTVVCPDPRGYGFRLTRPPSANHAGYAQRAMAADLVALIVGPRGRALPPGRPRPRRPCRPSPVSRSSGEGQASGPARHHPDAGARRADKHELRHGLLHGLFLARPAPFAATLIAPDRRLLAAQPQRQARREAGFHRPRCLCRRPRRAARARRDRRALRGRPRHGDNRPGARSREPSAGQPIRYPPLVLWGRRDGWGRGMTGSASGGSMPTTCAASRSPPATLSPRRRRGRPSLSCRRSSKRGVPGRGSPRVNRDLC